MNMKLGGLLNKLVSSGALSEQAALVAQAESTRDKKTIANYLVEKKLVAASKVASISAAEFGLPVVDLDGKLSGAITADDIIAVLRRR